MFMGICFIILVFLAIGAVAWLICVVQIERHKIQTHSSSANIKRMYISLALMFLASLWLVLSFFVQTIGQEIKNVKKEVAHQEGYPLKSAKYCFNVVDSESTGTSYEVGAFCLICDKEAGKIVAVYSRRDGKIEILNQ